MFVYSNFSAKWRLLPLPVTGLQMNLDLCLAHLAFSSEGSFSFVCLFVCFESYEQFFSYLATVTITDDGAANLDLCLALTAFSSEVLLRATPTATRDLRF
jgi:hypothetical protein